MILFKPLLVTEAVSAVHWRDFASQRLLLHQCEAYLTVSATRMSRKYRKNWTNAHFWNT